MLQSALCKRNLLVLLPVVLLMGTVFAEDRPPDGQETPSTSDATAALQKATQNPIASLISVPIQNTSNFGIGPNDRTQDVLNIQPVVPLRVSKDWNLIVRWIIPVIWQPAPGTQNLEVFGIEENTPGSLAAQSAIKQVGVYGFGDMQPTFFLSPAKPGKLIWGVGPYFILPTATNDVLGQGKLSVGPSIVALTQPGHWTIGTLINNAWSVAGSGGRADVNQMLLQPFVNYNLKKGWYLSSSPILTANWKATSGNQWVVPIGGGVGRIMKLGPQPVNISAQFFGNAVYPSGGSPWGMRLSLAFLFPKLTREQQKMMMEKKLKELEQEPPQKN